MINFLLILGDEAAMFGFVTIGFCGIVYFLLERYDMIGFE